MDPMKIALRVVGGVLAAILLVCLILFVVGIAPFERKSAAQKELPKVEKSVEKTQVEIDTATNEVAAQADEQIETTGQQMREGADELRSQPPPRIVYKPGPTRTVAGPPADVPDGVWLRRMCQYQHYAGNPGCDRYRR